MTKKTVLSKTYYLLSFALFLNVFAQAQQNDSIPWSIEVEDVVVTAAYAPTDVKNAIHQIRVLDQTDIQRLQARNLEQLLITDVNIRIEQDRALGSVAKLAGLDGQNVKIMIDGVPVVGRLNGNIDLSQIQLYDVERVEIVEGPLAVNYGTDALAGVINIITKKSQVDRYQLQADISHEDKGEQTASLGGGVRITDDLMVRGQFGRDEFLGFGVDTTRDILWNPKEQWYASASARYMINSGHNLRYSYNWYDETITNLGNVQRPIFKPYAFDERYVTSRNDHSLHYEGNISNKYFINSFVAWNQWRRQKDYWRQDMESGEVQYVPFQQDTSLVNGYQSRTTLSTQNSAKKYDFMIGIESRYEDFEGGRIGGPDSSNSNYAYIFDQALFGSSRLKLVDDQLILEGGLRYAYNNRYNAPILPSFNAKFELNQHWTFRASYGMGFRAPDIKELYFSFVDANHFILGNPELQPETSHNVQGGFTYYRMHKGSEVTMGAQFFYNHLRDKIELFEYLETPGGRTPVTDTITNDYSYFNISEFRTKGASVRFGYEREEFRMRVNYGLIGYYNLGHEELPGVRPYSYTNEVSLDARYTIPVLDLDAQLLFRVFDRQLEFYPDTDDDGNEIVGKRVQDGFSTLDFSLGKSLFDRSLRLTFGIRNLFDVRSVGIRGDNSILGAHNTGTATQQISTGRRWFMGLTYNLGW